LKQTSLHIVIAEDDPDDAHVIVQSFIANGNYSKVDVVQNGQELLDCLRSCTDCPDIVLTDLNMPIINGIEALTEMRSDPRLSAIPCFVYSTSINPVYKAICEKLGIAGFLIKPYTVEEFNNIPEEIIHLLSKA